MKVVLMVLKYFIKLEKNECLDLILVEKFLAEKGFNPMYDNESRFQQVVFSFGADSFSVFSSGVIIVRSGRVFKNEGFLQELEKAFKKLVIKNKVSK